ncbi:MAG: sn-glycerol-3-phosphate ABC transporter ATP-binding protein UgpC [Microbacteriaceae bacterium]|nr:sn-glycerol-3-phosphate ABC transporter ATP-binding protein UgpC [Microbacteriaceae bacterium]
MSEIRFDNASLHYPGTENPTIADLNLDIKDGEFLAIVGPSGSGKSTTLRMVAGLEPLSGGEIYIGDKATSSVPPSKRDVAMVFQSYALYPHMTVRDNLAFALKMQKVDKATQDERVAEAARMLDLEQYLDRYPKALSGGQRQRVAMGRAIVRKPRVFLMDEPLSNLDAKLRVSTRTEIMRMQRKLKTTMLYVTHDQTEAMTMADRIAVLKDGKLQQVGSPEELYNRPANKFVATFIGSPSMNLLDGKIIGDHCEVGGARVQLPAGKSIEDGKEVVVGLRPEALRITENPAEADLQVEVLLIENVGPDYYVHTEIAGSADNAALLIRVPQTTQIAIGDRINLAVARDAIHLFDPTSEERI